MSTPSAILSDSSYWIAIQPSPTMPPHVLGPYTNIDAEAHRKSCLMVDHQPIRISVVFWAACREQAQAIVEQFMRDE